VKTDDHYHLGIVVEDYESTLTQLTELFGYRWCEEFDVTLPVWTPGGEQELNLRFTYSMDAPRLEVIRCIPGTVWEPAAGSGIHHMGYWSDDVAGDSARLEQQGYAKEASAGPDDTPTFVYHRHPAGPRIELVASSMRPLMEQYWATGKSPLSPTAE
jgi:hypothetical protein